MTNKNCTECKNLTPAHCAAVHYQGFWRLSCPIAKWGVSGWSVGEKHDIPLFTDHLTYLYSILCTLYSFTDHLTGLPLPPWSSWVAQFWADTISSRQTPWLRWPAAKNIQYKLVRGRVMTRTRKACLWAEQNIQLWPYSLESYSFASISLSEKFIVNTEAAFSKYCTVKHEYGGCILSTVSTISKFRS